MDKEYIEIYKQFQDKMKNIESIPQETEKPRNKSVKRKDSLKKQQLTRHAYNTQVGPDGFLNSVISSEDMKRKTSYNFTNNDPRYDRVLQEKNYILSLLKDEKSKSS